MSTGPVKRKQPTPLSTTTGSATTTPTTTTTSTSATTSSTASAVSPITVVVRIRPPNQRELDLAAKSSNDDLDFYTLSEDSAAITLDNVQNTNTPNWNRFDKVFNPDTTQMELFQDTAQPIIHACLQGYNATILAYGQTGSGKTFSMTGPKGSLTDPSQDHLQGIIPRALTLLFQTIEDQKSNELYKDSLRDLLQQSASPPPLSIQSGQIKDLLQKPIASVSQAINFMDLGLAKRQTAATKMNSESSRSHTIFTIYITSQLKNDGKVLLVERKLHFVDLAGSESAAKTGATGNTQQEGAKINQSLLVLGKVIRELSQFEQQSEAKKANQGPIVSAYRESNLTKYLHDSFGKGNPLCLIANVSPSKDNLTETKSTLLFASQARSLPKLIMKAKAKVVAGFAQPTSDKANEKRDDENTLGSRFGDNFAQIDAYFEQCYHMAMLWKRTRTQQQQQQQPQQPQSVLE